MENGNFCLFPAGDYLIDRAVKQGAKTRKSTLKSLKFSLKSGTEIENSKNSKMSLSTNYSFSLYFTFVQ